MQRYLTLLTILALTALSAALFALFREWNFDDGYNVYRIAQHISSGHSYVFNIGEAHNPSTSVLNPLLLAELHKLTSASLPLLAHIVGGVSILGSALCVYFTFRQEGKCTTGTLAATATALLLAFNSSWGLEIHLFAFLLLLFVLLEQRHVNTWPLLGVLILVRPDAILLAALKWLRHAVFERRLLIVGPLQCIVVVAPWAIYSWITFHQIFPDTFSAKRWQGQSGYWGHGLIYLKALKDHLTVPAWHAVCAAIALFGGLALYGRRNPLLYVICFAALQQLAYVAFNVPAYHWYFSFLDLAIVLSALYVATSARLSFLEHPALRATALLVPAVSAYYLFQLPPQQDGRDAAYKAFSQRLLEEQLPEGVLAAAEVGTFSYFIPRRITDLTGLTSKNPEFITGSHNDLFYSDPPAVIVTHQPEWHFERAILNDVRYKLLYEEHQFTHPVMNLRYAVKKSGAELPTRESLERYLRDTYSSFYTLSAEEVSQLSPLQEASCILDQVNGMMPRNGRAEAARDLLTFEGWAVDKAQGTTPAEVFIMLQSGDKSFLLLATRKERIDVGTHLGNEAFRNAGFTAQGTGLDIPPGDYEIRIVQGDAAPETYCSIGLLTLRS